MSGKAEKSKQQTPPRRVDGATFVQTVDEVEYRPHEGEWVDFRRGFSWGYMMAQQELVSAKDDTGKRIVAWAHVVGSLSDNIAAWSLTDDNGEPLPQPYHNVEAFRSLSNEELLWLDSNVVPAPNPQS